MDQPTEADIQRFISVLCRYPKWDLHIEEADMTEDTSHARRRIPHYQLLLTSVAWEKESLQRNRDDDDQDNHLWKLDQIILEREDANISPETEQSMYPLVPLLWLFAKLAHCKRAVYSPLEWGGRCVSSICKQFHTRSP